MNITDSSGLQGVATQGSSVVWGAASWQSPGVAIDKLPKAVQSQAKAHQGNLDAEVKRVNDNFNWNWFYLKK